MSLRKALQQSINSSAGKCCTVAGYSESNSATSHPETATAQATRNATNLPRASNDARIDATTIAIALQQALKSSATNSQQEARRQAALAMLDVAPETMRAVHVDTDSDPDNVILTITIRHIATCEMLVPKERFDAWQLLALIDRAGANQVH